MSKYKNLKDLLNKVDEVEAMYLKAKEYDKLVSIGKAPIRCSFCGRPQEVVKQLITHNNVYACEHCVAIMHVLCEEKVENYNELVEKARQE